MDAADRRASIEALCAEGLDVTEWTDDPGARYPEHSHPSREVRVVVEGTITIHLPQGPRELGPGDRIDLAPGQPHAADVGPEGCTYLAGTDR